MADLLMAVPVMAALVRNCGILAAGTGAAQRV